MLSAVRGSNVVVTNPTHIAIALQYEHGVDDLPVVVAKGEDGIAALIRKTAEEAGVPILQNVQLERGLNEKVELDKYIGSEFFDAGAEVLHCDRKSVVEGQSVYVRGKQGGRGTMKKKTN